jgi:hypothetical protein
VHTLRWLTGVLAGIALLAAGCGGTTAQVGTGAGDLVPASAAVFIAVDSNPNSQQWQTVNDLAGKFPDKQKAVDSIKQDMSTDGVDWAKDVKPALGQEFDVVWLDFNHGSDKFVILTQPGDNAKFERLVAKANESQKNPADRAVMDKFHGWYVLGPDKATIDRFEQASDGAAQSLSDEQAFEQSMDRLGGDSLLRAYVNGQAVTDVVRKYGGDDAAQYLDKAGTLDWLAFRAGVKSDGIGFDAIVHGRPGELFKGVGSAKGFQPELPGHVPQDALLYFTFHGTKGMFASLQKNKLFNSPELRQYKDVFDDLDTLLQGENAFYLRPGNGRVEGLPFKLPELTFVASPGKADGAKIVDRLLVSKLHLFPTRMTVDGTAVRRMAGGGVGLFYGNVDGRLVFTDAPAGIRAFKHPGASLADGEQYQRMTSSSGLPEKTPGFVYIDIRSTIPFAEKLAKTRIPEDIRRNLKPLDSVVEYAATRAAEAKISFFLVIK